MRELQLTGGFRDYYAVPNPETESEAYENFKNVQEEFFRVLSETIPDINYFETINEPEFGGSVRPAGIWCNFPGWAKPEKHFDEATIAKICMDYCYAATAGVRRAGQGARVVCVALTGTEGGLSLLRECYKYIGEQQDSNPDNYFAILNWHPYVFYTYGTQGPVATVKNWDGWHEEWLKFQNDYYQVAVDAGDGNKPVWFTELGVTDCGRYNVEGDGWPTEGVVTEKMAAERLMKMLELTKEKLPYVTTAFIFRITDREDKYFPEKTKEQNFAYNYEANFGLVERFDDSISGEAALKESGKALYRLMKDGSEDYTPLYEMLNRHYDAHKEL